MNNLKFRAKAYIDNEWKYASNIHKVILNDTNEELWVIHPKCEKIEHLGDGYIKYRPLVVDEETIGQYTGIKDINGKEIYQGDILYCADINNYLTLSYKKGALFLVDINKEDYPLFYYLHDIEVVGNIHENKELLK